MYDENISEASVFFGLSPTIDSINILHDKYTKQGFSSFTVMENRN